MKDITVTLNRQEATKLVDLLQMVERSYLTVVLLVEWKEDRRQGYNKMEMLDLADIRDYATGKSKLKENQELKEITLDELGEGLDEIYEQLDNQL